VGAGLLALSMAIAVAAQLRAQTTPANTTTTAQPQAQPAARPAAPTTKIAVMNLTYVVNNYEKFKTYKNEIKDAAAPFQANDNKFRKQAEDLAKEAQAPGTTMEKREEIEKKLKDLQRQVEDNKTEAQKAIGKRQELQLYTLYLDVWNVANKVAAARGYDMILHFNDATDQKEFWSAPNIARKMQAGALMPIYYNPALDVSNDVLQTLNSPYANKK
jgi:Skp family chaperone for outer membrane proteins